MIEDAPTLFEDPTAEIKKAGLTPLQIPTFVANVASVRAADALDLPPCLPA